MHQYHTLLRDILDHGARVPTRAVLKSTGQRIDALSVFGYQMRFDLRAGFPAITTKALHFHSVKHELLWMLSGSTNIAYLTQNKVRIWDEWADETGSIGPGYGYQMRHWPVVYPGAGEDAKAAQARGEVHYAPVTTVDQIANLVRDITVVKNDSSASVGRRLILNLWNVGDIPHMQLPPCHAFSQFLVRNGELSCHLTQRSADAFLGVPFNIAQYALLTHLLAHVTGLGVGDFVHSFGDVHLYLNHLDQVRTQLQRQPFPLPSLSLPAQRRTLESFTGDDIELVGYTSHEKITGEVAV